MSIRKSVRTMGAVGAQCQSGGRCGTIQQTGTDQGGNAIYGCVTTRACDTNKAYNAGTIGAADGRSEYGNIMESLNGTPSNPKAFFKIHKGGTGNPAGGFGCYVGGVWKSPCPAKADMKTKTDGSEYSSIMSSMDAGGWPEGYLNVTGNNLDALKAIVTEDISTLNTLQKKYDNAYSRLGWLDGWAAWCPTNQACKGTAMGGQPSSSISDDTKAAFNAIGVANEVPAQDLKSAVNSALSAFKSKISDVQKKLDGDQKTYNDALAIAGKNDPDTIKAVADAQASVITAQSSASNTKYFVIAGIVLVLGGVAWLILRKRSA